MEATKNKSQETPDILTFLAYAQTVSASNEVDAIYRAAEKETGLPREYLLRILAVVPIDNGRYLVVNKEKKTSIVASVMPAQRPVNIVAPEPLASIYARTLGIQDGPVKRYIVTFYPRSYGRQRVM